MNLGPKWKARGASLIARLTGRSFASSSARSFAKSAGWIGITFLFSRAIGMIVPLLAARYLGKEIFGKATLAITVGQFLSMVMLLGMNNAVVRYGAPKQQPREEVAAALFVTAFATLAVLLVVGLGGGQALACTFHFEKDIIHWGVLFALFATAYVLTTSFLQAFHRFYERGVGELLTAVSVVFGFGCGVLAYGRHLAAYLLAICLAFLTATCYAVYHTKRHLGTMAWPAPHTLRVMTAYGTLSTLGNIGFILTFYIQPMILNKLLSASEVGLFRVYQTASITIAQSLSVIFNTVFFPKASASANRKELWRVTWRLWAVALLPLGAAYILSQLVLIPVAGRDYPLNWNLMGLFAITSLFITVQSTVGQFLGAEGVRGVAAGLVVSIVTGSVCVGTSYLLVPRFHLAGACLALLFAYAIALVLVILAQEYILRHGIPGSAQTPEREAGEYRGAFEAHSASEILPELASRDKEENE
ncbi:MAG: lipopolysaccharide biosynthesis protein [Candidatus Sumerlaeaceae bacterium]